MSVSKSVLKPFVLFLVLTFYGIFSFSLVSFSADTALEGKILLKETNNKGKSKSVNLKYLIKGNLARINTSYRLYYIINLDNEIVYTINLKRKTVTKSVFSDLMETSVPPLVVLKSAQSLKSYLVKVKATLKGSFKNKTYTYQQWNFVLKDSDYVIKVKQPEFIPEEILITSNKGSVWIKITDCTALKSSTYNNDYFYPPKSFKLLDLIGK